MNLATDWSYFLQEELQKDSFIQLTNFVKLAYQQCKVYPDFADIFRAFNLVEVKNLDAITEGIDTQIYEGTDEDFKDGPPCLAHLSKIMRDPLFDGRDRFMYNYHVFVKMKYPDTWKQKVKNAPVKYFEEQYANAWDDKLLNAKVRSWNRSEKGFTCTKEPISLHCKKGICVN